jgi:hypothetical protein
MANSDKHSNEDILEEDGALNKELSKITSGEKAMFMVENEHRLAMLRQAEAIGKIPDSEWMKNL